MCRIHMEDWINSDGDDHDAVPSLFWLHGGAGAGKYAFAQSLSEKYKEKEQLAASFFFFRGDPSRNNGNHLIPTFASHLVRTFKGISPFVESKIHENWDLFTKTYQNQILELLIAPLLALKLEEALVTHPRLIVIDGLDECESSDIQCQLLRVIARAIPHISYPLRFFVTSRPEAHITHVFDHDPDLRAINVRRYNLSDDPDADMDIRNTLEKEFKQIRQVHRLGRHLPHAWPDQEAVTSLVERSSRHFIYASTVIRYIRCPKHRPDDRLEVILRLRPPQEGDQPYAQLDSLYALIFDGVENRGQLEKICLVLGIVYFRSKGVGLFGMKGTTIEDLLEMKAGDLVLLLDPILSLVAIDGDDVRILHKSLFDYLLDFTRGGHLPFDLAWVHEFAATYILKQWIMPRACNMNNFLPFAYHCQYAYLNDTLKAYLCSLDVPYPKTITTVANRPPSWHAFRNQFLRSIIWYFFRIMSREDFDSTGQVYKQYMAKWMRYLRAHPAVPRPQSRPTVANVDASKSWLKRKLDKLTKSKPEAVSVLDRLPELNTLLTEWKPKNSIPMDPGMDPVVCWLSCS